MSALTSYFDLEFLARTNSSFREDLIKLTNRFEELSRQADRSHAYIEEANEALMNILRYCQFNPAFMVPHYFPAYPKDKPLSLRDFPFTFHLLPLRIGGYMCVRGSRQISKSTTFALRQRLNAHIFPKFKSMYIAPKTDQIKTYANRLRELERSFRYFNPDYKFRSNLFLKEFSNGSTIEIFNVDTQVENIRGKTCDEILFDEYQNFDPDFEAEVAECNSATVTPVNVYAGTSLTTDTALEAKYQASSQGVWVIRCPNRLCRHQNIPLPEHGVMDMIQPKGVSCMKCKTQLNVRHGRFFHQDIGALDRGQVGFHIPQIIVPFVVENRERYAEIYRKKVESDPNKFYRENLGIPTEEGVREITEGDMRNICTLGDSLEVLHKKARDGKYQLVVGGCDWGGSDYDVSNKTKVSYTVHTVMGITWDRKFEIIHMKRYDGMDYRTIADDISHWQQKLNAGALGADYGVGMAYNLLLRERMDPAKHLIFNYTGPGSAIIKENHAQFNQFSLNRTESITSLYSAVKHRRIQCYNWGISSPYLTDFLNLYRVPSDQSGSPKFLYRRHGAKADDTLHAINFAYTVGRMFLQEPIVPDVALLSRINQSLLPRGAATSVQQVTMGAFSM